MSGGFTTTQAGTTPQFSGHINAGNVCLTVYDVGDMRACPVAATAAHY